MADFGTVILPRMLVRFEAAKDALRRLGSSSTGDQSDAIVNNLFVNTVQDFVGVIPGAEAVYFDETTDNSITPVLTTPSAISTPSANSTDPAISTPQTISTRSGVSQTTDDCVRKRSLGEYLCNDLGGDGSGGGHFHATALTTGGHGDGYDLMPEDGDDLQSPGGSKKPRLDGSYYCGGCDGDGGDAYYCSSDHSKHGYGYHDAQGGSASDRAASEDVFTISPDGISFGDDVSGQTGQGHVGDVQVCDRMAKLSQRFGDGHQHGFGVFDSSGHSKHGDGNGGGQDGSSAAELLVSPGGSNNNNDGNNDHNNSEASEEEEIVDDDQLRVDTTSVGSSSPSNYQSWPQTLDDSFGKKCGASREVTTAATSASYSATALNHSNEPVSPTPSPNHFEASRSVAQLDDDAFSSIKGSPQFLSQFDLPESLLPLPSSSASLGASKKKNMKKRNNKRVITLTLDCMKKGCDLMSLDARDLTAHLWDNHNIGPYPCFVKGCGRTFYKKKDMDEHFLTSDKHLKDARMICNYCLRVYQSHDGLKRHVIFHHQTGRFQCGRRAGGCGGGACRSVCSFVATTRMQVYWHYEKVHRRGRRGARATVQEDERIGMKEGGEAAARASEQNGSDVKLEV